MAFVNFISLYKSLDEALSARTSPVINFHTATGVQLLPNSINPYIQTTNHPTGIELEDWTVFVVDMCSGEETEITDYFMVDRVFIDTNGQAQIDWSITNVPFDFGSGLVYLKVNQVIGETFYSNPFQFTANDSEKTCRIDYRAKETDTMQSIQIQMFFWQPLKTTEISTYYETSTRNTVTTTVKSQKYERWVTEFISSDLLIKITDVFENKFVYVDLIRCNLFEAVEIQEHESEGDFEENILKLSFINSNVYDPLYVEPSVTLTPSITLNSVIANGVNAIYDFDLENFNPTYLTYQFTQFPNDPLLWLSENDAITSPMSINFVGTGVWYFKIKHPEAISNIIELDLTANVEANNDNVSVEKGETIDVSVLFNDVLVGETLIDSVSSPTNGTATIIEAGTKIRYEHDDSSNLADTFTYTISNGITSDTATVYVTVFEQITAFQMNNYGHVSLQNACALTTNSTKYHDGDGTLPIVGDRIYVNEDKSVEFIGFNKYYSITGAKAIKINNVGTVTDVQFC